MKILITVSTFYPRKDGVQAVTEYLALGLKDKGHSVTIVTSSVPGEPCEAEYKGLKIIRVDVTTRFAMYFGNKKEYQALIIKLANNSDVMINVCTQNALTDYLYPVLDRIHCKKILHMHGIYDFKWHKTDIMSLKSFGYKIWRDIRWRQLYLSRNFSKYDRIIQLHRFDNGYKFFLQHYHRQCDVLENAAEIEFSEITNVKKTSRYCICVANYSERKNQELILKAYYKAQTNDLHMIFIGSRDNSYLDYLRRKNNELEKQYGEKDVLFLTDISRKETIEYVKNATIYLLGSTWEAFSISLIESMAAGVPFISTNVGVAKYLPGGVTVDNVEEMTYWIEMLANNQYLVESFGNAGHSYFMDHLTISEKVNELEGVISYEQ